MSNYAPFTTKPPFYGREGEPLYDRGQGVPAITEHNMTIQDIYRTPFLFIQEHRNNYKEIGKNALKGIIVQSELSKMFFSDENIKRIQKMIKKEVYKRTRGEFRLDLDQDLNDIYIAMRATYLENARFLPGQVVRQVKRLNIRVVSEIVPGIITELRQYYGYLKEINKPLNPIDRPINANNAGRLQLPSITTSWF